MNIGCSNRNPYEYVIKHEIVCPMCEKEEEPTHLEQMEDIITDLETFRAKVCELYESLLIDATEDDDEN